MKIRYAAPSKARQLLGVLVKQAGRPEVQQRYEIQYTSLLSLFGGSERNLDQAIRAIMHAQIQISLQPNGLSVFQPLKACERDQSQATFHYEFNEQFVNLLRVKPDLATEIMAHNEPTLH